jgi:hypothetical protein
MANFKNKKEFIQSIYPSILELVKNGEVVSVACEKLNVNRNLFYRHLTLEQKTELISNKLLNTKNKRYIIKK